MSTEVAPLPACVLRRGRGAGAAWVGRGSDASCLRLRAGGGGSGEEGAGRGGGVCESLAWKGGAYLELVISSGRLEVCRKAG